MGHRRMWAARWLTLVSLVVFGLDVRPGERGTAAQPEEGDPASELILLFSGEVEGNLEPCG